MINKCVVWCCSGAELWKDQQPFAQSSNSIIGRQLIQLPARCCQFVCVSYLNSTLIDPSIITVPNWLLSLSVPSVSSTATQIEFTRFHRANCAACHFDYQSTRIPSQRFMQLVITSRNWLVTTKRTIIGHILYQTDQYCKNQSIAFCLSISSATNTEKWYSAT